MSRVSEPLPRRCVTIQNLLRSTAVTAEKAEYSSLLVFSLHNASHMASSRPPFLKEQEINHDLTIIVTPDDRATMINANNEGPPTLPGHPRIAINNVVGFLSQELLTPELDSLSPHLWLVAT